MLAPHEPGAPVVEPVKTERLSPADSATVLTVSHDADDGWWSIWLDSECDSAALCIGAGQTRQAAIADALAELQMRLFELEVVRAGCAGDVHGHA
jgi:hypothetical protein